MGIGILTFFLMGLKRCLHGIAIMTIHITKKIIKIKVFYIDMTLRFLFQM
jgi:hypothetical protein